MEMQLVVRRDSIKKAFAHKKIPEGSDDKVWEGCLLGCNVQFGRWVRTFQKNVGAENEGNTLVEDVGTNLGNYTM